MVFFFLGMILLHTSLDVIREKEWRSLETFTLISSNVGWSVWVMGMAAIMLIFGKMQWLLTGIPTLGILSLYLLLTADTMKSYPYIVCTPESLYICIHTYQPKWVIPQKSIESAQWIKDFLILSYREPETYELETLHIDTKWFKDLKPLKQWLSQSSLKKAA